MRQKTEKLDAVADMPPLLHHPDKSQPFHILNSDVVRWLSRQDDVQQWLFNILRGRNLIVFDQATGRWKGKNRRTKQNAPTYDAY